MYIATHEDFQLLRQSIKNIYSKIELLNENFTVIDVIHGYVTAGSVNINADSDIRRTCSLTMVLANDSVLRGATKIIWLTKYVRIYIGYENTRTQKIQYYNQGIFVFGDNAFTYSAQENSVSLTCYDMMCNLNGLMDGQLVGQAYRIPALVHEIVVEDYVPPVSDPEEKPDHVDDSLSSSGTKKEHDPSCAWYGKAFFGHSPACTCGALSSRSSSRSVLSARASDDAPERHVVFDVMKNVLEQLAGITRYDLEVMKDANGQTADVPYDLDFETGVTIYTIFNELATLYDGYEFFFDVDGTFVFRAIPTREEDDCILLAEELEDLVISEQLTGNFSDVRNATEVWGMCHDAEHYSESSTYSDGIYSASVTKLELTDDGKIQNGDTFAVMITAENGRNPKLKINDLDAFPICDDGMDESVDANATLFEAGQLKVGNAYTFRFRKGYFIFLGEWQVHAICLLYNEYPWIRKARLEVARMIEAKELSASMASTKRKALESQYKQEIFKADIAKWNCDYIKYRVVPDNPFAIDALGGKVLMQVKSGGDYSAIYTDDLASERAEYDCIVAARYNDTLTLEMRIVPWLEVNQKIQYRVKHSDEVIEWLIKTIDFELSTGTMNVSCTRFYQMTPESTQDETTRGLKPINE